MKNKIILFVVVAMLLSSCASILNGKYQKITINKEDSDQILIDGEIPKEKNGKYLIRRDLIPKQITVKSEGFKDENRVIMQYKKSPINILSWIPFGILIYPPFGDVGRKSWNYDKEFICTTPEQKITEIKNKSTDSKKIKINKVSVDLKKEDMKRKYFYRYKRYLRNKQGNGNVSFDGGTGSEVQVENTIFSYVLNNLLKDKGYIDTTNTVLKNSYLDNLLINANVKSYTVYNIGSVLYGRGSMLYIDLSIDWEVLDYYEKVIYSQTTTSRSGEFVVFRNKDKIMEIVIKDVMEVGLTEFMNSDKVHSLLHDRSEIEKETKLQELNISNSNLYASGLSQSTKSSLTIKSKDSFGSGFIISNDGYIITNYHVVSDSSDLKVILNDKSEYDVEVIRTSKIYDLALLKIDAKDLIPYKINRSKNIEIASEVYAVGTPTAEDLSQTISRGIVSGVRNTGETKLIQTDASINNGNSGGPLLNKQGEVIGVVSSKLKGFGVEGVAFGIPAYEIFDRLKINIK